MTAERAGSNLWQRPGHDTCKAFLCVMAQPTRLTALALLLRAWFAVALVAGCAPALAPGERRVHSLTFAGVHSVRSIDLRRALATSPRQPFDPGRLALDLERIASFYADRGHFVARVTSAEVQARAVGVVDVLVTIDEGPCARVKAISLPGAPPGEWARLRRERDLREGDCYDYAAYRADRDRMAQALKRRGYARADVRGLVRVDRDARTVTIEYRVNAGPLAHFGGVFATGPLDASAVQAQVPWQPGDRYDIDRVALAKQRLYDLPLFSLVDVQPVWSPAPSVDVAVALAARARHELRLGAGVSGDRGRDEVHVRADALYADAAELRWFELRLRPAYVVVPSVFQYVRHGAALESEVALTQAHLANTPLRTRIGAGYDVDVQSGYDDRGPHAQIAAWLPLALSHAAQLGVSVDYHLLSFLDVDAALTPALLPREQDLVWAEAFALYDRRDDRNSPHSGAWLRIGAEEGLADRYTKVVPEARGYLPLGAHAVLAGRARLGFIGAGAAPLVRKLYLGGPGSHRGFGFDRLAPVALNPTTGATVPQGGAGELLLSLEARYDVLLLRDRPLGLVGFVDAGDVTPRFADLDPFALHVAVGANLAYRSPLGTVRAGAGVRLNRLDAIGPGGRPNPDPGQRLAYSLSLGEAF
jgi:outer membrane protein assembly factor BamA